MRKICVTELLSISRVITQKRVREEEVACMIEMMYHSASLGTPVDLTTVFNDLSNDILCRCVLGRKYGEDGDERSGELARKLTSKSLPLTLADLFSSLEWLDTVTGLIEEHIIRRKSDNNSDKENDFVDVLL
ncbi:hypothetical protein Scep_017971 [Stephania cephalantha]|uniref:Uncharacterized protein n=1 Tax=Stephania cephalantha TaxID=152367 RepID=A0AAP0IQH8_9MAGN